MFHIAKHETNEHINMCCLLVYRLEYIQQPVPMAYSDNDTSNSTEVNNYFYWYHVIFHNNGINFLNCQIFYHLTRLLFCDIKLSDHSHRSAASQVRCSSCGSFAEFPTAACLALDWRHNPSWWVIRGTFWHISWQLELERVGKYKR